MMDCHYEARRAAEHIKNNEPFEFRTKCLKEIVLYSLTDGYREWLEKEEVPWIKKLHPLVKMLSDGEKEYVAANVWRISRKYYDYVSLELGIKIILDTIHR